MTSLIDRGGYLARRALELVVHTLSAISPRRRNRVAFGAWIGARYGDNPAAVFEHIRAHHPELDIRWIAESDVVDQVPGGLGLRRGSLAALRWALTSHQLVVSHHAADVCGQPVFGRAKVAYLGHGLALKHMGHPAPSGLGRGIGRITRRTWCYDMMLAVSPRHRTKLQHEYWYHGADGAYFLEAGQPRNDHLVRSGDDDRQAARRRLEAEHDLTADGKLVIYLPTFRAGEPSISLCNLPSPEVAARLVRVLETHSAQLVQRMHPADAAALAGGENASLLTDLTDVAGVDTQLLLLAADVLVTDYSGCFFDFLLLDRPIVHYVHDLHAYESGDRGLYFDLEDVAGGPLVESSSGLVDALDDALRSPDAGATRRARVRAELLTYEDGFGVERVTEWIIGNATS